MSKILAVFGATGNQGGSLVTYVLNDPELSKEYSVRAITRDVNSEKSKQLKESGAEVVHGDITDTASLKTALAGVHTVFIMTAPVFGPDALQIESGHAKAAADVAVEQGVQYIIFSTLPHVKEISGGKYTKVSPFDAKAEAEAYIRTLPVKSAFYSPGSFMENSHTPGFLLHRTAPDGTEIVSRHHAPTSKLPLIAAVADTGKFVGAILAEPDKYEGKTFCAATALYTWEDVAAVVSKVTGVKTVYQQVSVEEYMASLPPFVADVFFEAFSYWDEFGYYGPETEEVVKWAAEHARGKLTTLEEYFEANPQPLA
ncbi:NAD(P)-binding protein [Coniochaeta ligniaria NRRL 30616]|uniref:NAD(P)-binding protein n=1 Tax=Coniochaeta ligniaria NRRL 30616 TaxID=1408157 RepID=A0A1J7IRN3_9PEZI|nr:NAD(P)-binding protein [Coniochaeta ligniaria NRRL 30616]